MCMTREEMNTMRTLQLELLISMLNTTEVGQYNAFISMVHIICIITKTLSKIIIRLAFVQQILKGHNIIYNVVILSIVLVVNFFVHCST